MLKKYNSFIVLFLTAIASIIIFLLLLLLFDIEKNSNIDTKKIRNKIKEKFEWWKENEQNDYKRWFKGKEVTDIFEYYNGVLNAKKNLS